MQTSDDPPGVGVEQRGDFDLDPLRPWSPAVVFRHSGWANDRRRVFDSFARTAQPLNRRVDFADCGLHAYVYQSVDDPDQYRIGGNTCHDRFCLPCGRERSRIIATNVLDKIQHEHARFLTLTLKSADEPLAELLTKLTANFASLRRSKLWRNKVTGGVAFFEVKWITKTNRWHPHLHCLVQGRYLPVKELSKLWLGITGTSYIVDIRFASDSAHVTHYITKYASKPLDHSVLLHADRLDEAVLALKGKRLCLTFGSWRGYVLTEVQDPQQWIKLGSLDELLDNASKGSQSAMNALDALKVEYVQSTRAPPSTSADHASSSTYVQGCLAFPDCGTFLLDACGKR